MLVSTEPLGDRFRRTAETASRGIAWFAGALVALALLDAPFYARLFAGAHETGVVVDMRAYGGKNPRCTLTVRTNEGWLFTDEASYSSCAFLQTGSRVPFLRVPGMRSFVQLGSAPGINGMAAVLGMIAVTILAARHFGRARPWYEAQLDERGRGRLRP
jgi:hypothetical protein